MATFLIPLSPQSQTFGITLNGISYFFSIIWRNAPPFAFDSAGWFLDIYSNLGTPIIQGMALVPEQNLLAEYEYLQLGFSLYLQGDGSVQDNPEFTNLGVNYFLYAVF